MVNWIIAGKYAYWSTGQWAQVVTLSKTVIQKVRKLAYKFIWDWRKGTPWPMMVLLKKKVGLGLKNFQIITSTIPIKREASFWDRNPSSTPGSNTDTSKGKP